MPHIDGYEIRERLGRDGQGEIYRAYNEELRRDVALKVPRHVTSSARAMLRREARALARVNHLNVVKVHTCAESHGQIYFTMELIAGRDAAKLIRAIRAAEGRLTTVPPLLDLLGLKPDRLSPDVEGALRGALPYYRLVSLWVAQAAEGLAAAHARGILHRDIKPANLVMADDGRMVVVDFGLARSLEVPPSKNLGVTGTYPYIAPERIAGDLANVDHRADIWALGATFYELLSRTRAYDRGGEEVLVDIATRNPRPLRDIRPDVPAALVRICERAMARDPNQRYQSWRELSCELRNWLGGELRPRRRFTTAVVITSTILVAVSAALTLSLVIPSGAGSVAWDAAPRSGPSRPAVASAPGAAIPDSGAPHERRPAHTDGELGPSRGMQAHASDPTAAHSEPCDRDTSRIALLVCNQDLNTRDDDRELTAGFLPQEDLLTGYLERNGWEVRTSLRQPRSWARSAAVSAAREAGATAVIYLTQLAEPGAPFNVSYATEPVYPWTVRLRADVVRVCDDAIRSSCATITTASAARGVDRITGQTRSLPDRHTQKAQIALERYDEAGLYFGTPTDDQNLVSDARTKVLDDLRRLFPDDDDATGNRP